MTIYAFETITAEQALNIQTGDYLTFAGGPASQVSVVYSPADLPLPARIDVSFGGRTVTFGPELADLSQRGALEMGDHSRLFIGDDGRDAFTGLAGGDAAYGAGGDDQMRGGDGDDFLHGNQGDDTLYGDAGSNTLYGGKGDDVINVASYGETKGSWAHGNQGNDEIIGGAGDDVLYGGQGDDFLAGKEGDDVLNGDLGDDEIFTGQGDDLASGGAGNDTLSNSDGSDALLGGAGDDLIVTYGRGHTLADGGAGADTLVSASTGQSILYGGAGRDRFEFAGHSPPTEGRDDVIADWGSDDQLHFAQVSIYSILPRSYSEFAADDYGQALSIADEHIAFAGAHYVAAQVGGDVIVFADTNGDPSDGADTAVVLLGRTLADISLSNFSEF